MAIYDNINDFEQKFTYKVSLTVKDTDGDDVDVDVTANFKVAGLYPNCVYNDMVVTMTDGISPYVRQAAERALTRLLREYMLDMSSIKLSEFYDISLIPGEDYDGEPYIVIVDRSTPILATYYLCLDTHHLTYDLTSVDDPEAFVIMSYEVKVGVLTDFNTKTHYTTFTIRTRTADIVFTDKMQLVSVTNLMHDSNLPDSSTRVTGWLAMNPQL